MCNGQRATAPMIIPMNAVNQADQTLHSLAQLLALTAMQWLPPRPDDSQTNLCWNSDRHRLEGRPFTHNGHQLRLVIDMNTFTLQFIDEREHISATFSPENRTPADALIWWTSQMQAWGVAGSNPLNYQLDQPPVAAQAVYKRPAELQTWAHWRTTANAALKTLNEWSGRESDIRIWPHHFDTGVYYAQTDPDGREKAAIWAGYAIADSVCSEPYFYQSGYQRGQAVGFGAAPALSAGQWRVGLDWQGALLPISEAADTTYIALFFRESYSWLAETGLPDWINSVENRK